MVPEPLEVTGDTVAYEFIRMPDSTGFGDYTVTGQVVPVRFRAAGGAIQESSYVHAMYLDDYAAPKPTVTSTRAARRFFIICSYAASKGESVKREDRQKHGAHRQCHHSCALSFVCAGAHCKLAHASPAYPNDHKSRTFQQTAILG